MVIIMDWTWYDDGNQDDDHYADDVDDDNNDNVENADDNDNEDLPDTNHEPTHEIRWSPRDGPLPSYLQW